MMKNGVQPTSNTDRRTSNVERSSVVPRRPTFGVFRSVVLLFALTATVPFLCAGCVSKSKAQAQVRLAYLAGQRDAFAQMQQQQADPDIKFTGPVNNRAVKWYQGLTLAKAILAAGYNSSIDPQFIIIRRTGQEIQLDPKRLLNGDDIPLQAGDTVEFRMPEQ